MAPKGWWHRDAHNGLRWSPPLAEHAPSHVQALAIHIGVRPRRCAEGCRAVDGPGVVELGLAKQLTGNFTGKIPFVRSSSY